MPERKHVSYRLGDATRAKIEEISTALHGLDKTRIVTNAIERYHREVMRERDRDRREPAKAE